MDAAHRTCCWGPQAHAHHAREGVPEDVRAPGSAAGAVGLSPPESKPRWSCRGLYGQGSQERPLRGPGPLPPSPVLVTEKAAPRYGESFHTDQTLFLSCGSVAGSPLPRRKDGLVGRAGSPRTHGLKRAPQALAAEQPSQWDMCTQAVYAWKALLTLCLPPSPRLPGWPAPSANRCTTSSGMGNLSPSLRPGTPFASPLGLWGCRWEEAGSSFSQIAEPTSSVKRHSVTGRTARDLLE